MDELIDVLPDDNRDMPHEVAKKCEPDLPPQPYAISYNPNWRVVGSTLVVYEGGGETQGPGPKASVSGNPGWPFPSMSAPEPGVPGVPPEATAAVVSGSVRPTAPQTGATESGSSGPGSPGATGGSTGTATKGGTVTSSGGGAEIAWRLWSAIWSAAAVCVVIM